MPVPPQKGTPTTSSKTPAAPPNAKGPKLPEPKDETLETRDGFKIKATYYPGTASGGSDKKQVVPIIMVHGIDGQRGDFHALALYLQSLGHASIVPDLRGHGESKLPAGPGGPRDPEKFNRPQLESMVSDIQACKAYLFDKHRDGEVNIGKLCVIGAEFGSTLAIRWAAEDWLPERVHDLYKVRNDVKGIVLLSPQPPYKAVHYRDVLPIIDPSVAFLILAGADDSKSAAEAKKLNKELQVKHPGTGDDTNLFFDEPETNLAGTKLLSPTLKVKEMIGMFIEKRLSPTVEWRERKKL
jgi:dienelactone hydrolase